MARKRAPLDTCKQAPQVKQRLGAEPPGWKRERLQAVQLGLQGELNLAAIAAAIGRSRATIQTWFDAFRSGGVDQLLSKERGPGSPSLLTEPLAKALRAELQAGTFRTGPQIREWLRREHGLRVKLVTVYKYLGKLAARLKVPRPSHAGQDEAAARIFKTELAARLEALALPKGRPVRLWVADEMRYGLKPVTRRMWGVRGHRIVTRIKPAYQWGYVWGALQVGKAASQFLYWSTVDLDSSAVFLRALSQQDPHAVHVVIWDGAGFHPRDGAAGVPENVRLLPLPAYSPELNPVEKLWDIVKDGICNRLYTELAQVEEAMTAVLRPYWEEPRRLFSLIGQGWLLDQANASSAAVLPH